MFGIGNGKSFSRIRKGYEESKTHAIPLEDKSKNVYDEDDYDYSYSSSKKKIATLEAAITELKAKKDFEIELLRKQAEANTAFLQQIIMELITLKQPALSSSGPPPPPLSAKELRRRWEEKNSRLAGPAGKLP